MVISHISYICSPGSPWMVLIHGFGGTKNMWKHQIEQFGGQYNLMVLELPGHGDSVSGLSDYKNMHIKDVAISVISMLKKHDIKCADFMCVSLGTLIMAGIMEEAPEMVHKVLMCGAVFGMTNYAQIILKIGNIVKPFFPYMFMIHMLADVLMPKKSHKISRKFLIRECKKLGRAEFMKWYSLLCREWDILKNDLITLIGFDSMIVMGSEDHVFLSPAIKAAKTSDFADLRIMPDCGHVCSLQKWREFNVIATDFFNVSELSIPSADIQCAKL